MVFAVESAQFGRFVDFLDFVSVDVGFGGVEFGVFQEAYLVAVFEHGDELEVVFVLDDFVAEHGCFFEFFVSVGGEEGDVA